MQEEVVAETGSDRENVVFKLTIIDTVPRTNTRYVKFLSDNSIIRKVIQLNASATGDDKVTFYCRNEDAMDDLINDWLCADGMEADQEEMSNEEFVKLVESVSAPASKAVARRVSGESGRSTIITKESVASQRQQRAATAAKIEPPTVEGEERIAVVTYEDGKYVARFNGAVIAKIARPEDFWSLLVFNRWTQKAKNAAITNFEWQCNVEEYVKEPPAQPTGKKTRAASAASGPNPISRMATSIESTLTILKGADVSMSSEALMALVGSAMAVLGNATNSVADAPVSTEEAAADVVAEVVDAINELAAVDPVASAETVQEEVAA